MDSHVWSDTSSLTKKDGYTDLTHTEMNAEM